MNKYGLVLGIGVDILQSTRISKLLTTKSSIFIGKFSKRILHPRYEFPKFEQLNQLEKIQYLSGVWCAKEALFKTLDLSDQKLFQFNQWYRLYDESGKPHIKNDLYSKPDEEFHLSISHDDSIFMATVLRQRILPMIKV
ncbi:Holo-acyl-carrier-protein synthase [Spathaspora sp. JA1]|nr:Holo-acyl-carrier-protein synthase [Spathaspora sp. JA1]